MSWLGYLMRLETDANGCDKMLVFDAQRVRPGCNTPPSSRYPPLSLSVSFFPFHSVLYTICLPAELLTTAIIYCFMSCILFYNHTGPFFFIFLSSPPLQSPYTFHSSSLLPFLSDIQHLPSVYEGARRFSSKFWTLKTF